MRVRDLHPNLRLRLGVAFVQRLLDSMVMTYMAVYLAARYGIGAAGLLVMVVMLLSAAAGFVGGHLSDTRGRRVILMAGEACVAVMFAAMAIASSAQLAPLVFAAYAVNKVGAGIAMPANDAMIVDVTTPENRETAYTLNYWTINLALSIGALLGGFLYAQHFTLLLAICAGGMCTVFVTTVVWLRETATPAPAASNSRTSLAAVFSGYLPLLSHVAFRRLVVAATVTMTVEFQLVNYIAVRLADHLGVQTLVRVGSWHLDVDGVKMLGILRAENTALVVACTFALAYLLRRLPRGVRLYGGVALFFGGYMALPVVPVAWVLGLAMLAITLGELMSVPLRQVMLADLLPATDRARYMAVYALNIRAALVVASLCISVGWLVGPWVMALLYGVLGLIAVRQYWAVSNPEPAARASRAPAAGAVSS